MGNSLTQEQREKNEIEKIRSFMNYAPSYTLNIVNEKCIRYFIKKAGNCPYNLWAFNRAGLFDPKNGVIIGLYSLLGLIASQKNENELKLLHELFIKRDNTFKGIKEVEQLTDSDKKLLIQSFEFLEAALPPAELKTLFKAYWKWICCTEFGAAVAGSVAGGLFAGIDFIAEGILLGTGLGAAIVGLSLLGFLFFKWMKKDKANEVNMDSCVELFNLLTEFFLNTGTSEELEEKLRILEENNLFIIRIDYGNLGSKRFATSFDPKNVPNLNYFDFLPKKTEEADIQKKVKRQYYKNAFKLYSDFFRSFDINSRDGNFDINVFKCMKQFSNSYQEIEEKMKTIQNKLKDKDLVI